MKKKPSLALQIFLGLLAGIVAGLCLTGHPEWAEQYIRPFGTLFLNLVKMVVVPIVLLSISAGVISMKDLRAVGSIGGRTLVFYLSTTAGAVALGLGLAYLCRGLFTPFETAGLVYSATEAPSALETLVGIFPSNAVAPLAEGNMLQVIVLALFLGAGVLLAGEKAAPVAGIIESGAEVAMEVMKAILRLSPIGVFALITPVVALHGPGVLGSLFAVILVCYLGYILHVAVVYTALVKSLAGLGPVAFFKGMLPAMAMAFSSASSVGTLPLNMACTEKLGASRPVVGFVLPLGATINMDGTAIYQGVCTLFIATCYGVELTMAQLAAVVLTATLASVGTAGVPGAGMVMLAMVLQSVGLPVEGIALVAGIDRILDMGRTTVNITGDAACALVVSRLQKKRHRTPEPVQTSTPS